MKNKKVKIEDLKYVKGIGKKTIKEIEKTLGENNKKKTLEEVKFPKKKYEIIYADPPWKYDDKIKSHGGGAESHYPCMNTLNICKLPVDKISAKNSVLFMWVTFPQLEEGLKVMKEWGFEYKTNAFTWVKTNKDDSIFMGMGRYTRANAEICLLGVKGKGLERKDASIRNTQLARRLKHSQKPHLFREKIEKLFGDRKRIELFAREKSKGWDCWGNEI